MRNDPQNPTTASPPDDLLCAFLQAAASGPWPTVTELLGQTPALRRLSIRPQSAGLPAGVPGFGDLWLILAAPGRGIIHAVLTGPLARGLVGLLLEPGSPDPTPRTPPPAPLAPAEAGLLTGLAATLLQDLDRGAFGIQDVAVIRDDGGPTHDLPADLALVCKLEVTCGTANGGLVLLLDAAAAQTLRTSAMQWRPTSSETGGDLPLVAELVLARTELVWSRLSNAQLGDAIVFPTPAPPDNHWPIHLAVAGRLYPAVLRRTQDAREVEIVESPLESPDAGGLPDSAPNRLPSTVTAVLGRIEITAGHLAQLAPGTVISLDHPLGETVQLRAGDRTIGAGELIEVDGSVGVRLTELGL